MNAIHNFVRVSLPNYFRSIPVPQDIYGFRDLSGPEILRLVAFVVLVAVVLYSLFRSLVGFGSNSNSTAKQPSADSEKPKDQVVNLTVEKDKDKVVTARDIEDLGDKAVFCRCWRSSKFPLCDGTHNKHNKETGDNVGPLIIERKPKEPESKKVD